MDHYRLVNILMRRENNVLHSFAVQLPKSFTDSLLLRLARNTIATLRPCPCLYPHLLCWTTLPETTLRVKFVLLTQWKNILLRGSFFPPSLASWIGSVTDPWDSPVQRKQWQLPAGRVKGTQSPLLKCSNCIIVPFPEGRHSEEDRRKDPARCRNK